MPIAANVPVSLYGTTVLPGDYVYADSSGVVVMPSGDLDEILESAARLDREERAILSAIREEDPLKLRKSS